MGKVGLLYASFRPTKTARGAVGAADRCVCGSEALRVRPARKKGINRPAGGDNMEWVEKEAELGLTWAKRR